MDIQAIKQRIRITDLMERYNVRLKKSGGVLRTNCPLPGHDDKTPSFVVYEETDSYYCFGQCAKGGDIFSFVQEMEGISFLEAAKKLADMAGVEYSPPDKSIMTIRSILRDAAEAYQRIFSPASEVPGVSNAYDYMLGRGFTPETLVEFGVGFAPMGDKMLRYLRDKRGYSLGDIAKAGLLVGSGKKDLLQKRVVFPIWDAHGDPVALSGRALQHSGGSKYVNTRNSPIFIKSRMLYNFHRAKAAWRVLQRTTEPVLYVVEGFMDVMRFHQLLPNIPVVAKMGMSLTSEQLHMLTEFNNIVFCPDSEVGALRNMAKQLLSIPKVFNGKPVRLSVVVFPEGEDPDSFGANSPNGFGIALNEGRQDAYSWLINYTRDHARDKSVAGLQRAVSALARSFSYLPPVMRSVYYDEIAEVFGIPRDAVVESSGAPVSDVSYAQYVLPKMDTAEYIERIERRMVAVVAVFRMSIDVLPDLQSAVAREAALAYNMGDETKAVELDRVTMITDPMYELDRLIEMHRRALVRMQAKRSVEAMRGVADDEVAQILDSLADDISGQGAGGRAIGKKGLVQ